MNQLNIAEWIAIAAIIIPTITAMIVGIWQVRVMRKLASPAVKQQAAETSSSQTKTLRIMIWVVLPILGIVFPILALFILLSSPLSFTKVTGFLISALLSLIVLSTSSIFSVALILKISEVMDMMVDAIKMLKDKIGILEKTVKKKRRAG